MKIFFILSLLSALAFSKELSITSEDGFVLYGDLQIPKSTEKSLPIVLFAHQFGADRSIWNALAQKLNAKGYATLNVDLRGHGKSNMQNGKENSIINNTKLDHIAQAIKRSNTKVGFKNIPSDLLLWLEFLDEQSAIDTERLYLFGSSLGGGAIVPLLNEYEAKGLVSISGGRIDALEEETNMALSMSMTKQLYIATEDDPLGAAKRAQSNAKKAILGTSLIIYGDGHGTVILPQVEAYIFTFLQTTK